MSKLDRAWLVDATYDSGRVTLSLVSQSSLQPFHWSDRSFRPYYLLADEQSGQPVNRLDLFTGEERHFTRIDYAGRPPKTREAWEMEVDPALSYAYDRGLRFGLIHEFQDNAWIPQLEPPNRWTSQPDASSLMKSNGSLKQSILKNVLAVSQQPIPNLEPEKVALPNNNWSEEEYYKAFILSRLANLPIAQTYRNRTVSEWIRSMLNSYYRSRNILIPNSEELRLGSTKKFVTGALTITPESGTYFKMVVLDFESLYPGVIDVFNLSYETIGCQHEKCKSNLVPGLDYHVCVERRGIYSAMIGALRELRIHYFKPLAKSLPSGSEELKIAKAAIEIVKLLLVSSYGVTIRIHGLASPLLGEAITAYGRHVLQSTFDYAKEKGLSPRYGDTDSVFLDNPSESQVSEFIRLVKERFGLDLAYERRYAVCVLSAAKKAYFGIQPDGEPEIKGLTVAKSNSPRFFLKTFQECLAALSEGRGSQEEFERAKLRVKAVVDGSLRRLKDGEVRLEDLEYRVELREDPAAKSRDSSLSQPYQAAVLLRESGKRVLRGREVGFVKVRPFKYRGRQFTVKPAGQASVSDINVEDYVRNLISSLSQTFEPMGIRLGAVVKTSLSDFMG